MIQPLTATTTTALRLEPTTLPRPTPAPAERSFADFLSQFARPDLNPNPNPNPAATAPASIARLTKADTAQDVYRSSGLGSMLEGLRERAGQLLDGLGLGELKATLNEIGDRLTDGLGALTPEQALAELPDRLTTAAGELAAAADGKSDSAIGRILAGLAAGARDVSAHIQASSPSSLEELTRDLSLQKLLRDRLADVGLATSLESALLR